MIFQPSDATWGAGGFGKSSPGLPSEATADEDAQAAWRWLARNDPDRPRCIYGHSLGGAIAIDLAAQVDDARRCSSCTETATASSTWRSGASCTKAAAEPKRFLLVEGGSHHSTMALGFAESRAAMAELFRLR